jgi:hypothetical protein
MSFDIFLVAFSKGEAIGADAELLDRLTRPHVLWRHQGSLRFPQIVLADGEADIYGLDDLGSGLMLNHVTGGGWELMVTIAREARLVILPVGCRPAVASEDMLADLPEEMRREAVVVSSGEELCTLIESA